MLANFRPGHDSGTVPAGLPQGETEGFYLITINRSISISFSVISFMSEDDNRSFHEDLIL